jgi:outer membrane protein assembly factor BamB
LVNNDGVETQVFTYGDSNTEFLSHLAQKADGGFLLAGIFKAGQFDHTYIISTDNTGAIIWEKENYNGVSDSPAGIVELTNGDIVFVKSGAEESTDSQGISIFSKHKLYVTRTNSNGDVLFETTIDDPDPDTRISARLLKTRDGYAILAGIDDGLLIKQFKE